MGHALGAETISEYGVDVRGSALNCPDHGSKGKIKTSTLNENILMRPDLWHSTP